MKRIDRLVLGEVIGPWVFGVAIFSILIMAGSFLFQFTEFVAKGVNIGTVLYLILLLSPGIMMLTFPMAMLLGTLLAFGRLSGESEITAIRAAGGSLGRIMLPVGIFGVVVSLLAFSFGEFVVPAAAQRADMLKDEIARNLEGTTLKPTSYMVVDKKKVGDKTVSKLTAGIQAKDFNFATRTLTGATLVAYDSNENPAFVMYADELQYTDNENWRIQGSASVVSMDGAFYFQIKDGAWPKEIAKPKFRPQDIFAQNAKEMQTLSMRDLAEQAELAQSKPDVTRTQLYNLEKGYWDKISMPLAALVYALLGAPLGIRNHRTGAASGFWIAVLIIFAYYMLINVLFLVGKEGAFPAWVASFAPVMIGVLAAGFTIHLKNR